jgi:hypothetical protein
MKNTGALSQLLDMIGASGVTRDRVLEVILQLYRMDGKPYERVLVMADAGAAEMIPLVCKGLGYKVVEFSPMTPLEQVKDSTKENGRGFYVIHLPMDKEVRTWVSASFYDPVAVRTFVWGVTGSEEQLIKDGFPVNN